MTDPIPREWIVLAATWAAGLAVAAAAYAWALRPLAAAAPALDAPGAALAAAPGAAGTLAGSAPGPAAVDPGPFAVALWVDPPAPALAAPAAAPEPSAAESLQLDLLGISRDDASRLRANLYDHAEDRVVIVAVGDRVRRFTVRRIDADAIELADGGRSWTLKLEEKPA